MCWEESWSRLSAQGSAKSKWTAAGTGPLRYHRDGSVLRKAASGDNVSLAWASSSLAWVSSAESVPAVRTLTNTGETRAGLDFRRRNLFIWVCAIIFMTAKEASSASPEQLQKTIRNNSVITGDLVSLRRAIGAATAEIMPVNTPISVGLDMVVCRTSTNM